MRKIDAGGVERPAGLVLAGLLISVTSSAGATSAVATNGADDAVGDDGASAT